MNPLLSSSLLPTFSENIFFTFSVLHGEIGPLKECAGCCDGSFGYLRKCGCSVKVLWMWWISVWWQHHQRSTCGFTQSPFARRASDWLTDCCSDLYLDTVCPDCVHRKMTYISHLSCKGYREKNLLKWQLVIRFHFLTRIWFFRIYGYGLLQRSPTFFARFMPDNI